MEKYIFLLSQDAMAERIFFMVKCTVNTIMFFDISANHCLVTYT
jgi:hypothetical protein